MTGKAWVAPNTQEHLLTLQYEITFRESSMFHNLIPRPLPLKNKEHLERGASPERG